VKIKAQVELLESLAALDAELKELGDELSKERDSLSGKRSHLSSVEERLERSRRGVEEMEKTRNDLTGELRQMGVQVEKSREKLSRSRTEREANAAQREVEELRKLYRDREVEVEKLSELLESAKGELAKLNSEREGVVGDLGATEGDTTSRVSDNERALAVKQSERDALVGKVPTALYRRYELVRKRRGTAIAATTDGTCSACHMRLQPMLFQKLIHGEEFGQCPSCNRILYFRPGQPAAEEERSGGGA
jgi:predicted  nucleic acid-binding Zn-ribbon protein